MKLWISFLEGWKARLDQPAHLYRYVLLKTLVVIAFLLLLADSDIQNVVYMGF
ncbi:MAG: hypothetical protein IT158_27745 [Bryobacterales bacterium]|nr:hypothetical protein [Bryobacterales bacterium]